jgi:WD40 repeat protein
LLLLAGTIVSSAFAWRADRLARAETEQRERADEEAATAQKRAEDLANLVLGLCNERGARLEEEGDIFGALLWYTEPLARGGLSPRTEQMIRRRLASYWQDGGLPRLLHTFEDVSDGRFTPDGRTLVLVIGSKVQVTGATTGRALRLLDHGRGTEVGLKEISRDGRRLLTTWEGAKESGVTVWDLGPGRPLLRVVQKGRCRDAVLSPDGERLLTAGGDTGSMDEKKEVDLEARLWEVRSGRILASFRHAAAVDTGAFSPKGDRIITLGDDNRLCAWDTRTFKEIANAPCVNRNVCFSADGGHFLTWGIFSRTKSGFGFGGENPTCWWEAHTLKKVREYDFNEVHGTLPLPDNRVVVSVDRNSSHEVQMLDPRTGQMTPFLGARDRCTAVDHDEIGEWILGVEGQKACVWSTRSGARVSPWLTAPHGITSGSLSADGRFVLLMSKGGGRLWDLGFAGPRLRSLEQSPKWERAEVSPDGKFTIAMSLPNVMTVEREVEPGVSRILSKKIKPGQMVLLDVERGRALARWTDQAVDACFSRDGKQLIRFYPEGIVSFLDLPQAETSRIIDEKVGTKVRLAGFPPSEPNTRHYSRAIYGESLAAEMAKQVAVWDTRSGKRLSFLKESVGWEAWTGQTLSSIEDARMRGVDLWPIENLRFSRDGSRAFLGRSEWDVRTGRLLRKHLGQVIAVSPDERWLAARIENVRPVEHGSRRTHLIAIFDLRSDRQHFQLWGRSQQADDLSLTFSADGIHLLVPDQTGLRIWDVPSGLPISLPISPPGIWSGQLARLLPDGRVLLGGGHAGIQLWEPSREFDRATSADLLALARLYAGEAVGAAGMVPSFKTGDLERLRQRFPGLLASPSSEQAANWFRAHLAAPYKLQDKPQEEKVRKVRLAWLSRLLLLEPGAVKEREQRGDLLAELGRWKEATADFDRCVREAPKDLGLTVKAALVWLGAGDLKTFRQQASEILRRHKGEASEKQLWMACAVPGLVSDTRLLKRRFLDASGDPVYDTAEWGVLVRAGRYEMASQALGSARPSRQAQITLAALGAANPLVGISALHLGQEAWLLSIQEAAEGYLLAIALHHKGQAAKARRAYYRARAMQTEESRGWEYQVVVQALRSEVEGLLGLPKK